MGDLIASISRYQDKKKKKKKNIEGSQSEVKRISEIVGRRTDFTPPNLR